MVRRADEYTARPDPAHEHADGDQHRHADPYSDLYRHAHPDLHRYSHSPTRTSTATLTPVPTKTGPSIAETIGIFRPSQGTFYLRNSNSTGYADIAVAFGLSSDYPVVGDWNGDGVATLGVYRSKTGQ